MTQTSKAFPFSSYIPYYTTGLQISNNSTTPNSVLNVATGNTLDSTGTYQISLDTASTLSSAVSGIGGLDTGTIAASTLYGVYLVADPVKHLTSGVMISASISSPTMPYGYSAYKLIGYVCTDASSHFLLGYWTAGNSSQRLFMFDAPQATAITAGNATSYTAISLAAFVPAVANTPVIVYSSFTPGAASRTLSLQPAAGTGAPVVVTGQVTSVVVTSQSLVMSTLSSSVAKINYKVSNSGDAAAINVGGYWFQL